MQKEMNLIDKVVRLDQAAMAPILASNGEVFDSSKRKTNIEKSLARGDKLVTHFNGDELLGYALIWKSSERELVITSLQVHPNSQGLLRGVVMKGIFNSILSYISQFRSAEVVVEAHPNNSKSISLSKKLGLIETPSKRSNRIELRQSVADLNRNKHNQSLVVTPLADARAAPQL